MRGLCDNRILKLMSEWSD